MANRIPLLDKHEGSWVIVDKGTLDAVVETFSAQTAASANPEKYDVLTIGDYLGRVNSLGKIVR